MTTEQGDLFWESAFFILRNDSECAAATGFPIDGNVFRVHLSQSALILRPMNTVGPHLNQICIPRITTDVKVVVCRFFSGWLPKNMS